MSSNTLAHDDMIARLENEVDAKKNFAAEIVHRAQSQSRDLTDDEQQLLGENNGRLGQLKTQLDLVGSTQKASYEASMRARQIGAELETLKGRDMGMGTVEYRSAGAFALDVYLANKKTEAGSEAAAYRLEHFMRTADHVKTGDNAGVIPDPVVGPVLNFIDAARPLCGFLGPRPMPAQNWHRPKVAQHTAVAKQGSAGAAGDEKAELTSQALKVTRLDASAITYGGYANVSRQFVDFSTPDGLQLVIDDLAANYAVETEAAVGDALEAVNTSPIGFSFPTVADGGLALSQAVWAAVGQVYKAVRGQGRLFIAVGAEMLGLVGPLFAPYGALNQQGTGFQANGFAQGVMGAVSGVATLMSAGLSDDAILVGSTAAIEFYEQRIGALQVTEPSVMGIQVAYAGYATALVVNAAGIVPLSVTS